MSDNIEMALCSSERCFPGAPLLKEATMARTSIEWTAADGAAGMSGTQCGAAPRTSPAARIVMLSGKPQGSAPAVSRTKD